MHIVGAGVLEESLKLRAEFAVAIEKNVALPDQKAIERIGEAAPDLHHELGVRCRRHPSNVHAARRELDREEYVVRDEPRRPRDLHGEEVGSGQRLPVRFEKRAPRRVLLTFERRLYPVLSEDVGDGAPRDLMAEVSQRSANPRSYLSRLMIENRTSSRHHHPPESKLSAR